MAALFAGNERKHGEHDPGAKAGPDGKVVIRNQGAKTRPGPATAALWADHLAGRRAIGIIPIRGDGTCCFGAIDVDDRTANLTELAGRVRSAKLPLIVTQSKSHGAHLWLFLAEPQPAPSVHAALEGAARRLGVWKTGLEIFPKQAALAPGEDGNWICAPYLGGDRRCAVKHTGAEMTVSEFAASAESSRATAKQLAEMASAKAQPQETEPEEGAGYAARMLRRYAEEVAQAREPGRNSLLFQRAAHLGNMVARDWVSHEQVRAALLPAGLDCGLELAEVEEAIKNGLKRGQRRPHADLDDGGRYPVFDRVVITRDGEDSRWKITIGEHTVTMSSDEVYDQTVFGKRWLASTDVVFDRMKANEWTHLIREAGTMAEKVEAPPDTTKAHQFREVMGEFLTNRWKAHARELVLTGRPWRDDDADPAEIGGEGGWWFSLSRGLMQFLDRERSSFRDESLKQIAERIREMGGRPRDLRIGGRACHLWFVPHRCVEELPGMPVPPEPRSAV